MIATITQEDIDNTNLNDDCNCYVANVLKRCGFKLIPNKFGYFAYPTTDGLIEVEGGIELSNIYINNRYVLRGDRTGCRYINPIGKTLSFKLL